MPLISVPYGKASQSAQLPDSWPIHSISPHEAVAAADPIALVEAALDASVGEVQLGAFSGVRSVAIAVNDKTRPVPHQHLLPPLLRRLEAMGIPPERITLVIATGTHPVMPPEEYSWILPQDIINRYPIICHDAYDESSHEFLGTTSRGTPVHINKHYMAADLRIVVGNIEPHQFMGFSGGVKSAAIGLAGKTTINHNHSMMSHDDARLGEYNLNPARQDVEEIGQMLRVDFALNALLNGKKQIVQAIAGRPDAVMAVGIPLVRQIFQVEVDAPFDLVIVSPGGHPKDINVYQAQKALGHASLIVKQGGVIVLVAACGEGTGSSAYENWITQSGLTSHAAVIERFNQEGFRVGPHKAYQISRDASKARVILVSEMDSDFVRKLLLEPAADLQTAIEMIVGDFTGLPRTAVMPLANATIPSLRTE